MVVKGIRHADRLVLPFIQGTCHVDRGVSMGPDSLAESRISDVGESHNPTSDVNDPKIISSTDHSRRIGPLHPCLMPFPSNRVDNSLCKLGLTCKIQ